jgi:hypothetical protein
VTRTPFSPDEQQAIISLYVAERLSCGKIAARLGCSSKKVRNVLLRAGIELRSRAPSVETRRLLSQLGRSRTGTANPFFGKRHSLRTRDHLSVLATARTGASNPFFGRSHAEEARARMSVTKRGKPSPLRGVSPPPEARARMAASAKRRTLMGTGEYPENWKEIRDAIVVRDSGHCLVCARTDRPLHVHHVDHDRANNACSNLMTLCKQCHLAYHRNGGLADAVHEAHCSLLLRLAASVAVGG